MARGLSARNDVPQQLLVGRDPLVALQAGRDASPLLDDSAGQAASPLLNLSSCSYSQRGRRLPLADSALPAWLGRAWAGASARGRMGGGGLAGFCAFGPGLAQRGMLLRSSRPQ